MHKIKIINATGSAQLEKLVQEWFDKNPKITIVNCSYSQIQEQNVAVVGKDMLSIAIIYR